MDVLVALALRSLALEGGFDGLPLSTVWERAHKVAYQGGRAGSSLAAKVQRAGLLPPFDDQCRFHLWRALLASGSVNVYCVSEASSSSSSGKRPVKLSTEGVRTWTGEEVSLAEAGALSPHDVSSRKEQLVLVAEFSLRSECLGIPVEHVPEDVAYCILETVGKAGEKGIFQSDLAKALRLNSAIVSRNVLRYVSFGLLHNERSGMAGAAARLCLPRFRLVPEHQVMRTVVLSKKKQKALNDRLLSEEVIPRILNALRSRPYSHDELQTLLFDVWHYSDIDFYQLLEALRSTRKWTFLDFFKYLFFWEGVGGGGVCFIPFLFFLC